MICTVVAGMNVGRSPSAGGHTLVGRDLPSPLYF